MLIYRGKEVNTNNIYSVNKSLPKKFFKKKAKNIKDSSCDIYIVAKLHKSNEEANLKSPKAKKKVNFYEFLH